MKLNLPFFNAVKMQRHFQTVLVLPNDTSGGGGGGGQKLAKKCHVLFEWPLLYFTVCAKSFAANSRNITQSHKIY